MRKIYILILLFIGIAIYLRKNLVDYYLNEPYITVHARSGLSNKIRVMLSYLYRANKENKKLKIIWQIDEECPELYHNLFQPIENMEVVTTKVLTDFTTWEPDNLNYIDNKYHKFLKPIPEIQNRIDLYKQELDSNNLGYISCHIRRTDIVIHQGQSWYKPKTDQDYMNFIDQFDSNMKIYLATDNKDTQDIFINKYHDRLVIKKIVPSSNLRQTSVQDALTDIYVCVGAKHFMGSSGSSFTDLIEYLRKL